MCVCVCVCVCVLADRAPCTCVRLSFSAWFHTGLAASGRKDRGSGRRTCLQERLLRDVSLHTSSLEVPSLHTCIVKACLNDRVLPLSGWPSMA